MKLIIAGSRTITDKERVFEIIDKFAQNNRIEEVVCGGARGVDELGAEWALEHDIKVKFFPANWNVFGKKAGYLRNVEMAQYGDELLLIWDGSSKGSKHMLEIMEKKEKPITEVIVK